MMPKSIIVKIEWDSEDCTIRNRVTAEMIAHLLNTVNNFDWQIGTQPFTVTEVKGYDKGFREGHEAASEKGVEYERGYIDGRNDHIKEVVEHNNDDNSFSPF